MYRDISFPVSRRNPWGTQVNYHDEKKAVAPRKFEPRVASKRIKKMPVATAIDTLTTGQSSSMKQSAQGMMQDKPARADTPRLRAAVKDIEQARAPQAKPAPLVRRNATARLLPPPPREKPWTRWLSR